VRQIVWFAKHPLSQHSISMRWAMTIELLTAHRKGLVRAYHHPRRNTRIHSLNFSALRCGLELTYGLDIQSSEIL
jgi:hypothetical protein